MAATFELMEPANYSPDSVEFIMATACSAEPQGIVNFNTKFQSLTNAAQITPVFIADYIDLAERLTGAKKTSIKSFLQGLFAQAAGTAVTAPPHVAPLNGGDPDATMVNVWYSNESNPTARKVWDALTNPINDLNMSVQTVLLALDTILTGLRKERGNTSPAVPGKEITEEQQHTARGNAPSDIQYIGPMTAHMLLRETPRADISMSEDGMYIKRGAASMKFTSSDVTYDGQPGALFADIKLNGKIVQYRAVAETWTASRLFFLCYALVQDSKTKNWKLEATPISKDSDIFVLRENFMSERLKRLINDRLMSVTQDLKHAVAVVEETLHNLRTEEAKELYGLKMPDYKAAKTLLAEVKEQAYMQGDLADIRQNFAEHARNEIVRNTKGREDAYSNNASFFAACPGPIKQTAEVFELVRYVTKISLMDKTPPTVDIRPEAGTESAWLQSCNEYGLTILNKTPEGLIDTGALLTKSAIVIEHQFRTAPTLDPRLRTCIPDDAPAMYVQRLKGDEYQKYITWMKDTAKFPAHWRGIRVVKVGNMHNPNYYVVFSKCAFSERMDVVDFTDPLPPQNEWEKKGIVVRKDLQYVVTPDKDPGDDMTLEEMRDLLEMGVHRISVISYVMEKLVMDAFNKGAKAPIGHTCLGYLQDMGPRYSRYYYVSGLPIQYVHRAGSKSAAAKTGPAALQEKKIKS